MVWYCSKVGLKGRVAEGWRKLVDCCIAQLSTLATLPHFERKEPSVGVVGVAVVGAFEVGVEEAEDWR